MSLVLLCCLIISSICEVLTEVINESAAITLVEDLKSGGNEYFLTSLNVPY